LGTKHNGYSMKKDLEIPSIEILKTFVLAEDTYVDLSVINGVTKTQVFKKVSGTKNTFDLDKEYPGDKFEQVKEEFECS